MHGCAIYAVSPRRRPTGFVGVDSINSGAAVPCECPLEDNPRAQSGRHQRAAPPVQPSPLPRSRRLGGQLSNRPPAGSQSPCGVFACNPTQPAPCLSGIIGGPSSPQDAAKCGGLYGQVFCLAFLYYRQLHGRVSVGLTTSSACLG